MRGKTTRWTSFLLLIALILAGCAAEEDPPQESVEGDVDDGGASGSAPAPTTGGSTTSGEGGTSTSGGDGSQTPTPAAGDGGTGASAGGGGAGDTTQPGTITVEHHIANQMDSEVAALAFLIEPPTDVDGDECLPDDPILAQGESRTWSCVYAHPAEGRVTAAAAWSWPSAPEDIQAFVGGNVTLDGISALVLDGEVLSDGSVTLEVRDGQDRILPLEDEAQMDPPATGGGEQGLKVDFEGETTSYMEMSEYENRVVVLGKVKNVGSTAVGSVDISATFYDADGNVVGSESTYVSTTLRPGQPWPFAVQTPYDMQTPASEIADYKLTLTPREAWSHAPLPEGQLVVQGDNAQATSLDRMKVVGEVANEGERGASGVSVAVMMYDAQGQLVDVVSGSTDPSDIPAGGSAGFELRSDREDVGVADYEVYVAGALSS